MRLGYVPALDGLRAIAIAGVVLHHATGYPAAGYLGVDLFFVLSGFLITTLLLDEHRSRGNVSIRGFYRRRALRLLPALFVLLGVFIAVAAVHPAPRSVLFGIVAGLGYFSNFVIANDGISAMPQGLQHLWSLAAEEQFYLVWPVVLFVALRARIGLAIVAVVTGILLTTGRQLELLLGGEPWHRLFFGVDTRSVSILIGCALALLLVTHIGRALRNASVRLQLVAVSTFVAFLFVDLERHLFAGPLLVVGLCCAALILAALEKQTAISRVLSLAVFVFVGRISYSLYLWHIPVFVTLHVDDTAARPMAIPAIALAVLFATASYYFIEVPFLRRKNRGGTDADRRQVEPGRRKRVPLVETGG